MIWNIFNVMVFIIALVCAIVVMAMIQDGHYFIAGFVAAVGMWMVWKTKKLEKEDNNK